MTKIKLEYDSHGEKLFYLILPFVLFIFMIITCYLWSEKEEKKPVPHPVYMSNVDQVNKSDRKRQTMLTRIGLILAWIVFIIVVCRVSPVTNDNEEFDPFMILSIDEKASLSEIKRAYHELSKQHHPDRGGDPEKFKDISKAYKTLNNEEAKENWEKYGNPDGQKELRLGFAIPQWLFDPKNAMFILCGYTSFFIIIPLFCCLCGG